MTLPAFPSATGEDRSREGTSDGRSEGLESSLAIGVSGSWRGTVESFEHFRSKRKSMGAHRTSSDQSQQIRQTSPQSSRCESRSPYIDPVRRSLG